MRASDLEAPFRATRALSGTTVTILDRCRAYQARMLPGQFFSHTTAAMLWGLPLPWQLESGPLHVTTLWPARAPRASGVVGHAVKRNPLVAAIKGLPVHAAADAWCELGTLLSVDELVAAGDRLIGRPRPLCSDEDFADAVRRYGSGRGAKRLRVALEWIRAGSESPKESWLRLLLVRSGLPEPKPNEEITLLDGSITHGDLVYRRYRVLVEYDGGEHEGPERYARDVRRLDDLAAAGWRVVRINKYMSEAEILHRVTTALLSRGWRA